MKRYVNKRVAAAACAFTLVAPAQVLAGPLPYGGSINPTVRVEKYPDHATPPPYGSRARLAVYDNFTNVYVADRDDTHLDSCGRIVDDIDFAPGPFANVATRVLQEMSFGWGSVGAASITVDLVIEFYDIDDLDYSGFGVNGQNMIREGASPIAAVSVPYTDIPAGYYFDTTIPLPNIRVNDSRVAIQAWFRDPATGLQVADPAYGHAFHIGTNTHAPVPSSPAAPGWTLPDYGRDVGLSDPPLATNNDAVCSGNSAAVFGGGIERQIIGDGNAAPLLYRSWDVRLKGNVQVTPPACTPIGLNVTAAGTAPANGVAWYCVTLPGAAADNAGQFLDIDTDDSENDTVIAVFNSGSELMAQDDDDGKGSASQLTFGIGRRQKTDSTGRQYDGRDGELTAGTYYIAVCGKPASFGDAFFASSTAPATNFNLRVRSNADGSSAGPAVPPDLLGDLGQVSDPGAATASYTPWYSEVGFYTFRICSGVCTSRFLDVDLSESDPNADTVVYVFNSEGQAVASNDDANPGVYFRSQLSFGNSNNPRPPLGIGAPPFAGQNGDLPAGTYYVGIGLYAITSAPAADRWHLRGNSRDTLPWLVHLYTNVTECDLPCCPVCPADFNSDGGVDGSDVEAFYLTWEAGRGCADVNEDGGVDGGDVETFFAAWESGGENCGE